MDWLNFAGGVASLVGLVVSIYTLYKVENLPSALRRQSRDQQLTDLIDKILKMSPGKTKVPESTAQEVEFLLRTIRTYYVSKFSFRQRAFKLQLTILEGGIASRKRREIILNQLKLIRHEIAIR